MVLHDAWVVQAKAYGLPREGSAAYQLDGEVTAHRGGDG
jgi:hypothetical protein